MKIANSTLREKQKQKFIVLMVVLVAGLLGHMYLAFTSDTPLRRKNPTVTTAPQQPAGTLSAEWKNVGAQKKNQRLSAQRTRTVARKVTRPNRQARKSYNAMVTRERYGKKGRAPSSTFPEYANGAPDELTVRQAEYIAQEQKKLERMEHNLESEVRSA